ncbi:DUF397 domain-containing protein [Streptomyces sioyaensis]|uniref:DUF397 domain-containing protein n=1 Tax=Streptomyces sioyaensis TaxID=67364 RepID=UPI001F3B36C6|nr:DUF397 domain-containing protein [Streptomyces sioyaensis]MCF3177951.1 DUF397 domain-containing protein [Streptomyces sioyaensis]
MTTTIPDASALTHWRKSSYSNGEGAECIEVADGYPGAVPVRDSKNPHGTACVFSQAGWSTFVTALKDGRFSG